jgi:hypothetical protein
MAVYMAVYMTAYMTAYMAVYIARQVWSECMYYSPSSTINVVFVLLSCVSAGAREGQESNAMFYIDVCYPSHKSSAPRKMMEAVSHEIAGYTWFILFL